MALDFGFAFDPFVHLDSTQDAHLYEYLVIPKTVEVAWGDEPAVIFALPGGGKSALRTYTEAVYRSTRGVKLPITYIPETYSTEAGFHFAGLKRALARALFIYLISYPDVFLQLSPFHQSRAKAILAFLPYDLDFLLAILESAVCVAELEQLLGVNALSGIQSVIEPHRNMARRLRQTCAEALDGPDVTTLIAYVRDIFEVRSFHFLIDGLDGFIETTPVEALSTWIAPLVDQAGKWQADQIYLKCFLPVSAADFPQIAAHAEMRTAALQWNDSLLAEVIRRRLYVASNGAFDSLDAFSAPDVRNVELLLARQLEPKNKLPRQMLLKTRRLIERAGGNPDGVIHSEDLSKEGRNVTDAKL